MGDLAPTVRAQCRREECQHVWTVAYLPMPLEKAAICMKNATCPKCADERPGVAV